ncbi:hypothetical protein CLU84_1633 [Comamonas sp. 26]|nr:hypothetical protein CLU84_1633 [Comamonas sp. 26]
MHLKKPGSPGFFTSSEFNHYQKMSCLRLKVLR